ncbi:hypothetical protein O0L34_g4751 [Tuta absoluta]|nr:hypothetical protein O0L34_g4751 [Tuta absoluta]
MAAIPASCPPDTHARRPAGDGGERAARRGAGPERIDRDCQSGSFGSSRPLSRSPAAMDETDASSEVSYVVSERDFCSLLIDLYRNRPVLWKVKHPHYADKRYRADALDEIAKELQAYKPDYTSENVRKKINIIRTNFNKEKHRVERWRAEGRSNAKPGLWYYNELLFLDEQEFPEDSTRRSSANNDTQEWIEPQFEFSDPGDLKHNPEDDEKTEPTPRKPLKVRKFKNVTLKRRRVDVDPEEEENGKEEDEEDEPEQYMTITTTYYKKPKKREDLLAETWAMKLKRMTAEQKIFAEKIINDVLYEGELGNLSKNGVHIL